MSLSPVARPVKARSADRQHGRASGAAGGPEVMIAAVGLVKTGPMRQLIDDYLGRIPWRVSEHEIELTGRTAGIERCRQESDCLLAAMPADGVLVALDPAGTILSSESFAEKIRDFREIGRATIFAIGGADGHGEQLIRQSVARIAFGPMTWPHELARVMLAEQLWRAHSILNGHPYHRAG